MKLTEDIDGWFNYQETFYNLIDTIPTNGTFVECGAWLGKSSSYLADTIKDKNRQDVTLYIVDNWLGSAVELDTAHKLAFTQDIYQIFLNNMGDRSFIPIRKYSVDAVSDFDNESLDVVFIDMSHEYEDVKLDIEIWLPKVKRSGYLAGHDASWPGVQRAIEEKFFYTDNLYLAPGDCWAYYNT
jgi:hypothetical protein